MTLPGTNAETQETKFEQIRNLWRHFLVLNTLAICAYDAPKKYMPIAVKRAVARRMGLVLAEIPKLAE
eukprot:4301317-Prorocentrum_lima.AAC.1